MNNVAVKLDNISKKYILHHEKPTLMESFFKKREEFWALKNINFEVKKGEKLGIIGPNGAGKSTLLKTICGITTPSTGKVKTFGRIASLIELTAGFHPDLTGEENAYINGLLLGMSRSEIKKKFKKIVDFSELHHFIDSPFYTYSGGMMLRLGFSIAIHSNPDILIVDEVLTAGDRAFQEKCQKRIKDFFQEKTVLFVSHNLPLIKSFCPNSIWLDKGKIKSKGKTKKVIGQYLTKYK
ncbi:MAG: ABC transporter ATP-binding protein [Candidatus Marinimicrobia bacterium]|nr:ABC transporter ATP-binding protein [Candidatus Neomarinimicrobiota bacterium]